jgi:hypothetical protein
VADYDCHRPIAPGGASNFIDGYREPTVFLSHRSLGGVKMVRKAGNSICKTCGVVVVGSTAFKQHMKAHRPYDTNRRRILGREQWKTTTSDVQELIVNRLIAVTLSRSRGARGEQNLRLQCQTKQENRTENVSAPPPPGFGTVELIKCCSKTGRSNCLKIDDGGGDDDYFDGSFHVDYNYDDSLEVAGCPDLLLFYDGQVGQVFLFCQYCRKQFVYFPLTPANLPLLKAFKTSLLSLTAAAPGHGDSKGAELIVTSVVQNILDESPNSHCQDRIRKFLLWYFCTSSSCEEKRMLCTDINTIDNNICVCGK